MSFGYPNTFFGEPQEIQEQQLSYSKFIFIVTAIIFFTSSTLLASCSTSDKSIDQFDIDAERPFGFSWAGFSGPGEVIGSHPETRCRKFTQEISTILPSNKEEAIVDDCVSKKLHRKLVTSDRLPIFFQKGDLAVVIEGLSDPVAYEYSYLHRVIREISPQENTAKRNAHAKIIKNKLLKKYGEPDASGYFDQSSDPGFFVNIRRNQPCDLWIASEIAILLCTERVILLDGGEMSLSFIKLDRAPFGDALRCMTEVEIATACAGVIDTEQREYSNKNTHFLDVLVHWIKTDLFLNCQSTNLEPIERKWELPQKAKAKAAYILGNYQGEELAQYVYENFGSLTEGGSETEEHEATLFLLKLAFDQGSVSAANEIGAALLFCSLGVEQNVSRARNFLEKAAGKGDAYSMKSLALIYLLGLMEDAPAIDKAKELLASCSEIEPAHCTNELRALREISALLEK